MIGGHSCRTFHISPLLLNEPLRMDAARKEITRIIFCSTLEILQLLTGEDYMIVKKTSGDCVALSSIVHESRERTWGPDTGPPTHPLIPESQTEQKILQLISNMIKLLTGEVPVRCQDVAVYFSMEEWEYLEEHKDRYQDRRLLTSRDGLIDPAERCPQDRAEDDPCVPEDNQVENLLDIKVEIIDEETDGGTEWRDGFIDGNPGEKSPRLLYSQDRPEDNGNVLENHQGEDLTNIKVEAEDERMRSDEPSVRDTEEEIPEDVITEHPRKSFMSLLNNEVEDEDSLQRSPTGDLFTFFVHPRHHHTDLPYHPPPLEDPSPEQSLIVTTSTGQDAREMYRSAECGAPFTGGSGLFTQKSHSGEKPYSCFQCGRCFAQKMVLIRHQQTHTQKETYPCSECGKCFPSKSNLVTHERNHTREKPYSCSECGKCFIWKSHLIKHEISHTGVKPFPCSECGKCFMTEDRLKAHERFHTGEKPFPCSECGKCFITEDRLKVHQRFHTGENQFSCSECGKCFTWKSHLVKHERSHTGEKPYACTECGKCFITKDKLKGHQRIHTGEKPFTCSECGKCFTEKSNLATHERSHTGEKPFSCSECAKCFTDKSSLVRHARIHTGEKPFSCSECGKCFSEKTNLITHERSHTGEKPFSCSECGKCFTEKSSLVRHERVHSGEKPFSCLECGKCFITKARLKDHQRSHTG